MNTHTYTNTQHSTINNNKKNKKNHTNKNYNKY